MPRQVTTESKCDFCNKYAKLTLVEMATKRDTMHVRLCTPCVELERRPRKPMQHAWMTRVLA
jgi:hypothetical protein